MTLYELVEWWWLLHRARRDPGQFLERAAWHIFEVPWGFAGGASQFLLVAAAYINNGKEIPGWVIPRKGRAWV